MLDLESLDFSKVVFRYDEPSDTLMIHLYGERRPGISVIAVDHTYVRVDPHSQQVVGLQIEDFLSRVLPENGLDALCLTERAGISRDKVLEACAGHSPQMKKAAVQSVWSHLLLAAISS